MERLSTGIDELDALIQGYPKGKTFLVSGDAGTGKTILALHFLNACCKDGLKCIYIAMEENPEDLKAQANSFGWDMAEYEEKGLLQIIGVLEQRAEKAEAAARIPVEMRIEKSYQNLMDMLSDIREKGGLPFLSTGGVGIGIHEEENDVADVVIMDNIGAFADVVIMDNIGAFVIGIPTPKLREQLDSLVFKLNELECTALIVCDETVAKMTDNVMMYSVYGAIKLMKRDNPYIDTRERVMDIVKIRNTKIPLDYMLFDITDKGIALLPKSEAEVR
jgi:KaiC/GvpD/RAD55 family RecA-like ATPase